MKIFVTGASGFLGKFLADFLVKKGHVVTGVSSKECDLKDPKALSRWNQEKFDQVFHLAAWTQAGDFCLKHPGEQWLINQKINTHVLDWWVHFQPQAKLIAMGTSCSYAYDPSTPLQEEYYLVGEPIDSLFTYAMTKRMLLCGLKALQKQYGLNYLYVVPSTLYGPNYHTDGRQMHFIFDLIRKIIRGHLYGDRVVLWGHGEQKREVIHVNDFVEVLYHLALHHQNEIVNVGSGEEHSIKQFAEMICKEVGYPFEKIEYDLTKYVGALSKVLSVQKLKRLLPQFSPLPVTKGIKEVVDWFSYNKKLL